MAQLMPHSGHHTVLLTGGTGQVGVFVLPRLLAAGYPVIACSRKALPVDCKPGKMAAGGVLWFHPDALVGTCSPEDPGQANQLLQRVDVLLSCGPVSLAVRMAPHCTRLRRVVCVSSSSVYTKAQSPDASERGLIAAIRASEDDLKHYCKSRGIELALLHPTLIYGCGLDRNISRIARLAKRFRFMPVAGRASGRRQPLHADDLANLLLTLLEARGPLEMDCPVGGGSIITYREMVERIFTAIGQAPRVLPVPPRVLAAVLRAFTWLPAAENLNAETVFRQNRDLVFDNSRLRRELGFNPRQFEPVPEDFTVPAVARRLQPWMAPND